MATHDRVLSDLDAAMEEPRPVPDEPRPSERVPPATWVRDNLFNSPLNTVLTIVFSALAAFVLYRAAVFLFVSGRWSVIEVNLANFMVGRYPRSDLFRVWVALYVAAGAIGLGRGLNAQTGGLLSWRQSLRNALPALFGVALLLGFTRTPTPTLLTLGALGVFALAFVAGRQLPLRLRRRLPLLYVVAVFVAYTVLAGVSLNLWGGFLLTAFVAIGGIVLSFPIGVLLGLGRRSTFPAIRVFCVGYIELIRGVPLITLLFIGSVTIGLFLPPSFTLPSLVMRGLIVIIIFTAAYLAEAVRGGLQSVPTGQIEAAKAIGLSPLKTTFLIVLPQALRNVIPTIVGQFISLFKDTSLLTAIGLIELLEVGRIVLNQGEFEGQGLQGESFVFVSFVYWVCCYSMSRASQRLEKRLGVGER
jgi:general L-amino acid transport system permease protein